MCSHQRQINEFDTFTDGAYEWIDEMRNLFLDD